MIHQTSPAEECGARRLLQILEAIPPAGLAMMMSQMHLQGATFHNMEEAVPPEPEPQLECEPEPQPAESAEPEPQPAEPDTIGTDSLVLWLATKMLDDLIDIIIVLLGVDSLEALSTCGSDMLQHRLGELGKRSTIICYLIMWLSQSA